MDFAFKKTQRKRKIMSEEPVAAVASAPAVEQPPPAQRLKLDLLPQSRRKSRVGAAAAAVAPPAPPAAEPQPAQKQPAHSATRSSRVESPIPSLAASQPAVDPKAELVLEAALAQARDAIGADGDDARQSAAVVGRFLELVRGAALDLSHLTAATNTLPKLPLVDALERESRAWTGALESARTAVCEAAEAALEPALAAPVPAADLAPDINSLCMRGGFVLDAADVNVRWARLAQGEARVAQQRAAERTRAKAFGAYEHMDNPQALIRAVTAA
jgi:hypothetical protein